MESHPLSTSGNVPGKRSKMTHDSSGITAQTIREREAEQRMKRTIQIAKENCRQLRAESAIEREPVCIICMTNSTRNGQPKIFRT